MTTPKKSPLEITGVQAAVDALNQQAEERRELFSTIGSFKPAFESLSVQYETSAFRKALAENLVGTTSLAGRQDFVRALQVTDLSRSVQVSGLTSVVQQLERATLRGAEMWARVAEQVAEPMRRFEQWAEQNRAQISAILEGVARFHEALQARDANAVRFVEKHGWPLPAWLLEFAQLNELVAMVDEPRRDVTRAVKSAFRPGTRLRREADGVLLEAPHFASRKPLMKQALTAMRRDEWYLVINALLPLVEGLLVDVAYPPEGKPERTKWRPAYDAAQEAIDDYRREVVVPTFETMVVGVGAGSALFESFDARRYGVPGEPRALNRHAILHGAARRYGTAENALKLYLLLIVMIESLSPPSTS